MPMFRLRMKPGRTTLAAALGAALMATTALPAAADNFTLRIGAGHPSGPTVYVSLLENFFVPEVKRRVAEETEHTVDFVEAYAGAIASVSDTLEAVESGLLDLGAYCFCFEPSKLFIHNFPYYAPFGPQDSVDALTATRATYDEYPWLSEVFETDYNQILLGLSAWDNYHLGTVRPWETVQDLQNVRIGGAGPNLPWLAYAGAVPVQSALPDGYMNMRTGVYDGWLMFPSAYLGYRYYEPAPEYTLIGFGAMAVNGLTINSATMARLPEEVQTIIREVGQAYEEESGRVLDERQAEGLAGLEAAGANIKTLPEEVRAEWAESLRDFPNIQAKEADGRGLPGSEIMQTYLEKAEEIGVEWLVEYPID